MNSAHLAWAIAAGILILGAVWTGKATGRGPLGLLLDDRGRFSLTHLQLTLWSIIVISLIAGVWAARAVAGLGGEALEFDIPNELLIVMGISVGSAVASNAIKASKPPSETPAKTASLRQVMLVEEGDGIDEVVDIAKFQNFWITFIVAAAYVVTAAAALADADRATELTALPGFSDTIATLLGISHAGYLAGKIPDRPTTQRAAVPKPAAARVTGRSRGPSAS